MDGQARITQSDLEYMLDNEAAEPKALPLSLLAEITNDFSDKQEIGKGGFAVVYMAMLSNGDVAVKRLLSNAYLHEKEFQREVQCLMKMKHKNIVRFLGYCADTQGNAETYNGKFVMADVQQKLLCFEYLPKGSLHVYITDASGGLEWKERYKIIKGICEGLHYLHQINILHLDLKPANILLDENMIPKITDFGLSRCFDEGQTRVITTKVGGTVGYLAPESSDNVITHKFDLYSLGMIITEILTGKRGYQPVKNVLESWSSRLEISPENPQWKQIKVCAEIGIECTEYNPAKRPDSVQHILERLVETEGAEVIQAAEPKEPFDVYPLELCFPFESSKKIPCSLHLTNNTKEHVAFRLMDTSENCEYYFEKLPLYGTVPPRSTYTIVVAMKGRESQLRDRRDLILERTTLADEQIHTYQSQPGKFIKKAKNKGNVVHAVTLKAVSTPPRVIIPSLSKLPISPKVEILTIAQTDRNYASLQSLDTDQAKEWILTGEKNGYIRIWNYQTKKKMDSLRVSPKDTVTCVKFIARKQWFVAGTKQGCIHVYNCETNIQKIMSFRASNNGQGMLSLSVHPTQPYLLTWNDSGMKLWDWDKGWKCTQTFDNEHYNKICQAVFNQKDTIASASMDRTVRVWSLDSRKSNYTLFGHTDTVNCLDFLTCDGQEYLVTGSNDQTAKIWDMQKKKCARTLEAFMYPIMSVLYQPNLQILITCSKDGSIYLWRITNTSPYICSRSRMLERIIKIGCHGAFRLLACSRERVVIGQADADAVAIIDIGNNVNNQEQSIHDYSEPLLSPIHPMRPGDTTCKVMSTSSELLLDIQQSLELHFPSETNESIYYLLHLTNKTNEHVAFRLIDKRSGDTKPLFGIVPSISTYMSIIETKEEAMKLREEVTDFDLVLQSSTSGSKYMMLFDDEYDCDEFFTEAKEIGRAVQEAAVILPKDVYHLPELGDATCELPANPLTVKIISMKDTHEELYSLDAHPTEPWIITGHANGDVHVWNHETQKQMNTFKVSELSVCTVKLVARKQWIVAGTTDGFIHVYNCVCVTEMQKITAFRDHDNAFPYSLAVHPFQPYVLSNEMKLWDWDKCWEYTEPFGHPIVHQVTFNPEDANSFASASPHDTVQVWSLDSTKPIYTLSGHLEKVNCLDFFRQDDQQYLITGSHDHTAKIWDLRKKSCIHTLQAIMSPVISVITLPGRPYLVTGSEHGTVQVWSSTDFRLKRTVNLWSGGPVRDLVCLMGSRRVVIGQKKALSIMEISDEDTVASEGSK